MLLFSAVLSINPSLTKERFIQLAIEWNQGSPHTENIIPGLRVPEKLNIRFGTDTLWMDIQEYRNQNIIAVRYEKVENDGAIWNTDYVMNFNEMKMAIQLYRSYKEEALTVNSSFSAPYFITLLINHEYLKEDVNLPVSRAPIDITASNLPVLANIVNGKARYELPVVYVSKTVYNDNPIDVNRLADRLKGAAHVLVQEDKSLNAALRQLCNDKNEYNGAIGIYYPNPAFGTKRYIYHKFTGFDTILLDKIVRDVILYANLQNIDNLYTWQGVNNALLSDRLQRQREERQEAEKARLKAENEVDEVYGAFDEEFKALQKQVRELTRANETLTHENQKLRSVNSKAMPVLYYGEEDSFYPDEIKDLVLAVLDNALTNTPSGSRKYDILKDILSKNDYRRLGEARQKKLRKLLKGYKGLTAPMRQELSELGFEVTDDNKHYKLTYYGDSRYWTTLSKTPGDHREGQNIASTIIQQMM